MSGLTVIFTSDMASCMEEGEEYGADVVKILQPQMNRIDHLALYDLLNHRQSLLGYMATFLHAAGNLKRLRLYAMPIQENSRLGHLRDVIVSYSSPKLSELVFSGVKPVLGLLQMDNISHLSLDGDMQYMQKLLEKFSHCLKTLRLSGIEFKIPEMLDPSVENVVHFTQLTELHLDLKFMNYLAIPKLFSISSELSLSSVTRFHAANSGIYNFVLASYFSALSSNHEKVKIVVEPEESYMLLLVGRYRMKITRSRTCDSVWILCEQVVKLLHSTLQMDSLKSLELNFHGLDSKVYRYAADEDGEHSSLDVVMAAVKEFISKARCLQRIQVSFGGAQQSNEEYFYKLQIKVITVFHLLLGSSRSEGGSTLPVLNAVVLKHWVYGANGEFSDILLTFLSAWKNSDSTLRVEEAHLLAYETIKKLSALVGTLYIDGDLVQ